MHALGRIHEELAKKTGHGYKKLRSFTVYVNNEMDETTGKETRGSCEVSRRKLDMGQIQRFACLVMS